MKKAHHPDRKSFTQRLETVAEDVQGIAKDMMSPQPAAARPAQGGIPPRALDAIIQARAVRDQHFGPGLFSDPAWDILLHLFASRLRGSFITVSDLGEGIGLASTTASRWMKVLLDRDLVRRIPDKTDRRRVYVELTDNAARRLEDCLQEIRLVTSLIH